VKKLFLVIAAASLMAACGSSTTAPVSQRAGATPQALHDGLACRSGYIIAYDENGNPYCVPE
jgi:hypothetical protein